MNIIKEYKDYAIVAQMYQNTLEGHIIHDFVRKIQSQRDPYQNKTILIRALDSQSVLSTLMDLDIHM